jgi:hypothetical protein
VVALCVFVAGVVAAAFLLGDTFAERPRPLFGRAPASQAAK